MSDTRFTSATKYDAKKPPMSLIPWEAMEGVSQVLDFGRVKYSAHNWRKGFEWVRLTDAALRHVFAWLSGEENDPESGLSHIDHALCCLMFLSAHIKSNLGKDDRAHKLLAPKEEMAPQTLSAAHVPVHKEIRYEIVFEPVVGTWKRTSRNGLDTLFVSREVAEHALKKAGPHPVYIYKVREAE